MNSIWRPNIQWQDDSSISYWTDPSNWEPNEVPMDKATFNRASNCVVGFDSAKSASVSTIDFDATAQGFSFVFGSSNQPMLNITGDGINNASSVQQSFIIAARCSGFKQSQLTFQNSACAGNGHVFFSVGPVDKEDFGGGVVHFQDNSNAGSARFSVWTGAGVPPKKGSTVGGEVAFSDASHAANAHFVIYGTLGVDGDTFGNVVFHDTASANQAFFENIGGTVAKGDGGNTQFYGTSSADQGIFHNYGGTHNKANGGDVAFDSQATGANGIYHNYPAPAAGAYGGVTSFNNNWPYVDVMPACTAASGHYINYGAGGKYLGGGGHTSFSAKYGSCTADKAVIENRGSSLSAKSSAGHTIFSVTTPSKYYPSAGQATIYNYPAETADGAAGYTAFSVYASKSAKTGDNKTLTTSQAQSSDDSPAPTAAQALIKNYGGSQYGVSGGYTAFSGASTAGNALLIAYSGEAGGYGGKIAFYDNAKGDSANVILHGNGELSVGYHTGELSIKSLEAKSGGVICTKVGSNLTKLSITDKLSINAEPLHFYFMYDQENPPTEGDVFDILQAPNLPDVSVSCFSGTQINGLNAIFEINDTILSVYFSA